MNIATMSDLTIHMNLDYKLNIYLRAWNKSKVIEVRLASKIYIP